MRRIRLGAEGSYSGALILKVCAATLLVCLFLPPPIAAGPIVDMYGSYPSGGYAESPIVLGWSFRLSVPLDVHGLGIWDENLNGLGTSHSIGLWTAGGALLASAVIGAGGDYAVASQLTAGQWLFMPVATPLSIGPGDYVLGATYASHDPDAYRVPGSSHPYVTLPGVTFLESLTLSSSTLQIPTGPYSSTYVLLGPNLDADVIPEPSTLLLLGAGLAGLTGRMRRRRR